MEFLGNAAEYILSLDSRQFMQHIGVFLGFCLLSGGGAVYYIYTLRSGYIEELKQLHVTTVKSRKIISDYEIVQNEEERVRGLLDDNKTFNMKSYFEQFCKQNNINPEFGWDTDSRSIEGNDAFDEIILQAQFNNQTTEKLVSVLNNLDKNEIVYTKELEILREEKTISFTLTIATRKHKRFWDES